MMVCLGEQGHIARCPSSVVPLVVTPYMPTRVSHPRLWKDGRVEECMNILIVNGFRLFKVTTCYLYEQKCSRRHMGQPDGLDL